jgi:competence protein ComEC
MGPGLEMMEIVAKWVAGIAGAASRIPAISPMAILMIFEGGLWLHFLRCRLRLMGVLAIAPGVAVAPLDERPDVLIGDNRRSIVVRDTDRKYSGLTSRFLNYELSQRLARDGDGREAGEV